MIINKNRNTYQKSDNEPQARHIAFVSGGVIPGNMPHDVADRPASRQAQLRNQATPSNPEPMRKQQTRSQERIDKPTYSVLNGMAENDLDMAPDDGEVPRTPPSLNYPTPVELPGTPYKRPHRPCDSTTDEEGDTSYPEDDVEYYTISDDEEVETPLIFQFRQWQSGVADLKDRMKDKTEWSHEEVRKIFGELGLLQWWHDVTRTDEARSEATWAVWKSKVIDEWKQRYPSVPPQRFNNSAESLSCVKMDPPRVLQSLAVRIVKQEPEDVDMDANDSHGLQLTHIPFPVPPSTPVYQREDHDYVPYERTQDSEAVADLKERVEELEERVERTSATLRERIGTMDKQMWEDAALLTNMKWAMKKREDEEEEKVGSPGKRSYRKAKAKGPAHRYPTRYATRSDDGLELSKEDLTKMEERVEKVETRMGEMREELNKLRDDLAETEELMPKIDALTTTLNTFRASQIRINIGSIQEFARVQALNTENILPRLETHAQDITNLNARFNMLYALALSMLGQKPTVSPTYKSSAPHSVPPFVIPTRTDSETLFPVRQITAGAV